MADKRHCHLHLCKSLSDGDNHRQFTSSYHNLCRRSRVVVCRTLVRQRLRVSGSLSKMRGLYGNSHEDYHPCYLRRGHNGLIIHLDNNGNLKYSIRESYLLALRSWLLRTALQGLPLKLLDLMQGVRLEHRDHSLCCHLGKSGLIAWSWSFVTVNLFIEFNHSLDLRPHNFTDS
jgi:hypothetical protein